MEACNASNFYLKMQADGGFALNTTHSYYYQVQAQIKICKANFCDFVVWNENDLFIQQIMPNDDFIQFAFTKATTFFKLGILPELLGNWYSNLPVHTQTSHNPNNDRSDSTTESDSDDDLDNWSLDSDEGQELVTDSGDDQDVFPASSGDDVNQDNCTCTMELDQSDDSSNSDQLWCFCREPESGQMIACDNDQCPITWFHTVCVNLKRIPKGNWYCPECKQKPKNKI